MHPKSGLKTQWQYERSVPRCEICRHFVDRGGRPGRKGGRFKCGRFGFRVQSVGVCDAWVHKVTGEKLEVV